jgi:hypothetical protein
VPIAAPDESHDLILHVVIVGHERGYKFIKRGVLQVFE